MPDKLLLLLAIASAIFSFTGLLMLNNVTAEFIKGLFHGLNHQTAYRLGLWLNGLIAAISGGLIGGGSSVVAQLLASPGPIRWATVIEWAKGGIAPAIIAYFASSPLQKVFDTESVSVTKATVTPDEKTESSFRVTTTKSNESDA